MNAKELLAAMDGATVNILQSPEANALVRRALRLLAAIEDASGPTPETDAHATPYNEDGTDWIRADFARRLEQERNAALRALEMARHALAEIREEWAGAECGEPVTAQEGYAIGLVKRMYQLAVEGLK